MIHKISKFLLLKILALLVILTAIGFVLRFFLQQKNDIKTEDIAFLSISDQLTDSVISLLTLEQKLDQIIQIDSANIRSEMKFDNNQASIVLENNENLVVQKKSKPADLLPVILKINAFSNIGNDYFNSINDSVFVTEYFNSGLINRSVNKNDFIFLPFEGSEIDQAKDSNYAHFQYDRLILAKQIFTEKGRIFGLEIKLKSLLVIDSLSANANSIYQKVKYSLNNDMNFIIIDSLTGQFTQTIDFKGLCAARLKFDKFPDDNTLTKLLKQKIDIYKIPQVEYQNFKNRISELLKSGKINASVLDEKLRKIVKAKIWISSKFEADEAGYQKSVEVWKQQLVKKSIALLNNPDSILPVKKIDDRIFTIVWFGNSISKAFLQNCSQYADLSEIQLKPGEKNWKKKLAKIPKKNFVIYVLDEKLINESDKEQFVSVLKTIQLKNSCVLNFVNYLNLNLIPDSIACTQIQAKTDYDYQFAAQAIFGGFAIQGNLPVNVNNHYPFAKKCITEKTRVEYSIPGNVNIDENKLKIIDQIALEGIQNGAYPGCQIFVAKDGVVIYNKSFGYHTYSNETPVQIDDVYDLASVTKIASTTIAAMKMLSDRKMTLNDQLGKFFKNTTIDYTRIKADTVIQIDTFYKADFKNLNKFLKQNDTININDSAFITKDTIVHKLTPKLNIFKVPLIDLLKHQSGIIPATPIFRYIFYREYYIKQLKSKLAAVNKNSNPLKNVSTIELPPNFPDSSKLSDTLKQIINLGFKKQYQEYFTKQFVKDSSDRIRLTENLYLKNRYFDTIWRDTKQLPVSSKKIFQYSDVNMILLQLAIDSLNNLSIDEYLKKTIYNSLGLKSISYLPLKYFPKNKIIPTEIEDSWRFGFLHGYVHDPSAALMGGMVGNAGLYSNARDLGILFQMILNQGKYGGIQYINPSVIRTFTERNDETNRGLGFEMPNRKTAVGEKAPKNSYGHTGYTGTCVWVDPENHLVYVFLSNRNNPSSKNWRLNTYKIRERIHDAIYNSIITGN